jgi:4-diphosphocytidyl-2-C-methyl-D-erythritol kinase
MPDRVTLVAPAKVNLRLKVLAREESGFHALETVFCALSLADALEVRHTEEAGVRLTVEGDVDTGPPERNLVVRAAERFYRTLRRQPKLDVRLRKRIPSAAGLGGGSSDAAAMLRALNALEGGPLAAGDLLAIGVELGSDVPFFLCGSTLALGWSRGERLLALLPLPPRPVLVAHPGAAMPTPEAFRRLASTRETYAGAARGYRAQRPVGVGSDPGHRAERLRRDRRRGDAAARRRARDDACGGCGCALLAGSGAAVFGIFRDAADRDAAGAAVERLGMAWWPAETLESMPDPDLS